MAANRLKTLARYILPGTLVVLVILLGMASLAWSPEFVIRVLRWGDADVYDYQKFPDRKLTPSDTPFEFSYSLEENWIRAQFESAGEIDDFEAFLEKNRTQAFIVIHEDTVIYEQYFSGADRDSVVTSFSIAKSFTSALIGIAISEGTIQDINDPITDYLPELAKRDPAFSSITIQDLLRMSSGIKYSEPPDDALTYYYPDLRELALERTRITGSPGENFLYNNYHPLLLGMILERATGTTVTNYLQEKIWEPAGMQYPASWSLDKTGFEKMESGINARAIDFAKFGYLYLNNGKLNGIEVIPSEWVSASTQPQPAKDYSNYYGDNFIFENGRGYYQYMWWGIQRNEAEPDFSALGNHGQFIYLSPSKDLMILRFGEKYGQFGSAQGWLDLFFDFASEWEE